MLDALDGQLLGGKYRVDEFLDAGSIGHVYKVTNLGDPKGRPLVAKIQQASRLFSKEAKHLQKVQKMNNARAVGAEASGKTAEIIDHGHFIIVDSTQIETCEIESAQSMNKFEFTEQNSVAYSYIVMPRYGASLEDLIEKRKSSLSAESIFSLGLQLLNILETIHSAGLVFNDLK